MPNENDRYPVDPKTENTRPLQAADAGAADPNDEIPVPEAMSAAEIDERGQVVEALRGKPAPKPEPADDAEMKA